MLKNLPQNIKLHMEGMELVEMTNGCSSAKVYHLTSENKEFFLKHFTNLDEFTSEINMLDWLDGRLSIPKLVAQSKLGTEGFLLMTAVDGGIIDDTVLKIQPLEIIEELAEVIKKNHSISMDGCPNDRGLTRLLEEARCMVEKGLVDVGDWEDTTDFATPEELLGYLMENRPEEDDEFSHGDFTFDNVLFKDGKFAGLIDLGTAGVSHKWQDIALCVRSLRHANVSESSIDHLFTCMDIKRSDHLIDYFVLLDELF